MQIACKRPLVRLRERCSDRDGGPPLQGQGVTDVTLSRLLDDAVRGGRAPSNVQSGAKSIADEQYWSTMIAIVHARASLVAERSPSSARRDQASRGRRSTARPLEEVRRECARQRHDHPVMAQLRAAR